VKEGMGERVDENNLKGGGEDRGKSGRKGVRRGEVERKGVDIAWPYLYLSLRDTTAAASGPVGP